MATATMAPADGTHAPGGAAGEESQATAATGIVFAQESGNIDSVVSGSQEAGRVEKVVGGETGPPAVVGHTAAADGGTVPGPSGYGDVYNAAGGGDEGEEGERKVGAARGSATTAEMEGVAYTEAVGSVELRQRPPQQQAPAWEPPPSGLGQPQQFRQYIPTGWNSFRR